MVRQKVTRAKVVSSLAGLFGHGEPTIDIGHNGLRLAAARTANLDVLRRSIDDLEAIARAGRVTEAIAELGRLVPEYQTPVENVQPLFPQSAR